MFTSKKAILSAIVLGAGILLGTSLLGQAKVSDDLQLGPRPQGMGGAFIAVADDINAGYWNPAGIPQLNKKALGFMHSNPFGLGDISLNYLSFIHPTALSFLGGGFGFSFAKQSAQLEQGPEASINEMEENTYILSLGGSLPDNSLYFGVNFKALSVSETDEGISRAGSAYDLGLLYYPAPKISLGLMLRNLSAHLGEENFSTDTRVGVAGRLLNDRLLLAADYASKEDVAGKKGTSWQSHLGAEYWLTDTFALRVGSDKGNMTAGLGLTFNLLGAEAPEGVLDYSYRQDEELGYTHRFALTVLWD